MTTIKGAIVTAPEAKPQEEVGGARVMSFLYEMGAAITACANLQTTVSVLLKIMKEYMDVSCGMFTLHHHKTGTIYIHQSIGLSEKERKRGVYNLGEGITGKVVETKQAIIVPKIGEEPMFLGRTHSRTDDRLEYSFVCIPILRGKKALGAISVEKHYTSQIALDNDVDLLTFVASIMAQSVELYLLENEEKTYWESENRRLQEALKEKFRPSNIIGNSSRMREVYAMIEKVAKTRTTALILGESGVGKERFANAIHYNSAYSDGPFVKFNCAALPESIIESELFGHEKGAFTGAGVLRKGRFEEADGGSIFLDEIGELSLSMQAKLLRVLQEKTFERVGGNKPIRVNIRIIAATNRDLSKMVAEGTFREDLFYRLNVFPVVIPPLRERGSDIISLCDHFVLKCAKENNKNITRISTPALQMLVNYDWPGNVRELENVIERAVILTEDEVIHAHHLPPSLQNEPTAGIHPQLESKIETLEYEYIVDALKKTRGHITNAAKELGMTRRMLGLRLEKYRINYHAFH